MSPVSKRRSRPDQPDAVTFLMDELETLLAKEHLFTPYLEISGEGQELDDITAVSRNRSINVLRCLKMWYDLSSEVFIVAVNIVDCFLTKMKVQSKHIPCVSVSSLYMASILLEESLNPDDVVNISQSQCTSRDLQRMTSIIRDKLHLHNDNLPVTTLSFLRLFYRLLSMAADRLSLTNIFHHIINQQEMEMQLEIIACHMSCSNNLPSTVALALVFINLEQFITRQQLQPLYAVRVLNYYAFAVELKKFCDVTDYEFTQCLNKILSVLNMYNGELKIPYRQRLVWKVSSRTLRKLRPTKQLTYILPTIVEDSTHTIH